MNWREVPYQDSRSILRRIPTPFGRRMENRLFLNPREAVPEDFTKSFLVAQEQRKRCSGQVIFAPHGTGPQMGNSSSSKGPIRRQDRIYGFCLFLGTVSHFHSSKRSFRNS